MLENINLALQGVWSHKLRSFLTMLGIIIGIAAIITIVSTIRGTNEQIKQNLIGAGNDMVQVQLTQDGISVGQSTVYRTVERLVADGVVSKVPSVDRSSARYCYVGRPETAAHGKLVCLQCGATRPLECHMLDELSQHLEGAHGFRIEPSRTVLYGLCAKCADGIEHSEHSCKGGCCHEH